MDLVISGSGAFNHVKPKFLAFIVRECKLRPTQRYPAFAPGLGERFYFDISNYFAVFVGRLYVEALIVVRLLLGIAALTPFELEYASNACPVRRCILFIGGGVGSFAAFVRVSHKYGRVKSRFR